MRSRKCSICTALERSSVSSPLPSSVTRYASLQPPTQHFGWGTRATPPRLPTTLVLLSNKCCTEFSASLWATHPGLRRSHLSRTPWPLGPWQPAVSAVLSAVDWGTEGKAGTPSLTGCTWMGEGSMAQWWGADRKLHDCESLHRGEWEIRHSSFCSFPLSLVLALLSSLKSKRFLKRMLQTRLCS